MNELVTCVASLGIGISLGLIGAGGSILTIPVFVYVLQKDPITASIYSMFVVGICSLAGSLKSIRNQLVDFRAALLFGVPSVVGVVIARKGIFPAIPARVFTIKSTDFSKEMLFMFCLAVLMFIAATRMLQTRTYDTIGTGTKTEVKTGRLLVRGLLTGMISGLLGIGGGFLVVPALYFWADVPIKTAIGTTLLIIALNSLISFFTSYTTTCIDWNLLFRFSLGSVVGILVGIKLSEKIPGASLKKVFGWFVLSISFYIVYREFYL